MIPAVAAPAPAALGTLAEEEGVGADLVLSDPLPLLSPLLSSSFLELEDDSAAAASANSSALAFSAATPILHCM